ncbi:MAG: OmpA family protein [Undibacterium sp.]|nr:OmpA family protein [Opitutaceae bacterium]
MARKKAAAHHGGAWKVAYADFVTAMMALFMVLWISSQNQKILISTAQYFQNPFRSPMDASSGVMPYNTNKTSSSSGKDAGDEKEMSRSKHIQMTFLNSVAADFYRLLNLDQDLANKPIDVQVTSDGLRITLFDRAKRPLFVGDTAEFTPWGKFVMQNLAWNIDRHKFRVTIDGHTRQRPPLSPEAAAALAAAPPDYTDWELSSDRANAARRSLVHFAVEPGLVDRVTGYADAKPVAGEAPTSEANERVTLSLTLNAKARLKDKVLVDKNVPITPGPADTLSAVTP